VSRGETCIPPALVEKLAAGMRGEALTGRELEVLALLACALGISGRWETIPSTNLLPKRWGLPAQEGLLVCKRLRGAGGGYRWHKGRRSRCASRHAALYKLVAMSSPRSMVKSFQSSGCKSGPQQESGRVTQ